jgi:hypothetical protein
MLAYLKAFVAYLKAYVFSKYSGWQSMKSMTVLYTECVSGSVTQRQRSHSEHLSTVGWSRRRSLQGPSYVERKMPFVR